MYQKFRYFCALVCYLNFNCTFFLSINLVELYTNLFNPFSSLFCKYIHETSKNNVLLCVIYLAKRQKISIFFVLLLNVFCVVLFITSAVLLSYWIISHNNYFKHLILAKHVYLKPKRH